MPRLIKSLLEGPTLKTNLLGRYLVDYDNPDAGIGHSLGHVNTMVKICMRHGLAFAYSDKQIIKSKETDLKWRWRQLMRIVVGRKAQETHGIGDAISRMFAFKTHTVDREDVEAMIKRKQLKRIAIPGPVIAIPSNAQDDDIAYARVDAVVRAHPEDGVVFVLPAKRTGDFEYGCTRDWFKRCYIDARSLQAPGAKTLRDEAALTVALHVRRGDLLPGRQFADLSDRMLPDSWYVGAVEALARVSQRKLQVVVLSEGIEGKYCSERGVPSSLAALLVHLNCEVVERIDHDFRASFEEMVQADVLIGSKSGMTHLAGLMNNGLKLVPKMWHSYRGTGHVLELDEKLNARELEAALHAVWSAKPIRL